MRALRVKDEFVASVSHELRTPLTSIRGYVDLLRERDDLPDNASHFLGVVARNAERLGRLVADLLHSAQVGLGPMQVVRTRGDLAHIVREDVAAAAPVATVGGVSVESEIPRKLAGAVGLRALGARRRGELHRPCSSSSTRPTSTVSRIASATRRWWSMRSSASARRAWWRTASR